MGRAPPRPRFPPGYRGCVSNVERDPVEQTVCAGPVSTLPAEPSDEVLAPREVPLGGPRAMLVRRSLPNRDRRMVGAWCFADSYGPEDLRTRAGMRVPPHPHTGLQTVSWLLAGEILHHDSLGNGQLVRPGELSLMTAGHGISHSEHTPDDHSPRLHGVQLWTALPEEHRHSAPQFAHHADLPTSSEPDGTVTVFLGQLGGAVSPARVYSPLLGADVAVEPGGQMRLPLEPDFEHAVLAVSGQVTVDGRAVPADAMYYLGPGRRDVRLDAGDTVGARALLLGGAPFEEPLVMWWNFVARTHDEIVEARTAWEEGRVHSGSDTRFGVVGGFPGPALPAPALPQTQLKARGRYRHA